MTEDDLAIPAFLKITKEDGIEAWKNKIVKPAIILEAPKALSMEINKEQVKKKSSSITKKIAPNPKTHHWDTVHGKWVPNRIYKREDNMRPNFYALSNSELVQTYNEMAIEAAGLGLPVTATKRFSTRDNGIRRSEELFKTICDKKGLDYEQPEMPEAAAGQTDGIGRQLVEPVEAKEQAPPKPLKASKKKKPAAKKTNAKTSSRKERAPISEACKVQAGTYHEKILLYLEARMGKQIPEEAIIRHLYGGELKKTNRIKDLERIMKSVRRYQLKREEDEKGNISYGLYNGKNDEKNGNDK